MLVAAYNVGSIGIKTLSNFQGRMLWLPETLKNQGKLSSEVLINRFKGCLELLPDIIDSLVIINSYFVSLSNLRLMADIAHSYSKKVTIILPIVARIQAVIKDIRDRDIPNGSYVFIITPTMFYAELLIIQNRNGSIYPIFRRICKKGDINKFAQEISKDFRPNLLLINCDSKSRNNIDSILPSFELRKVIRFDKFFPFLSLGGIEFAASVIGKSYWRVSNFCTGIDANDITERKIISQIVPFGAVYPFIIKQISYHNVHMIKYSDEVVCSKETLTIETADCFVNSMLYPENTNKIIVEFDDNGIPYPGEIPELFVKTSLKYVDRILDNTNDDYLEEKMKKLDVNCQSNKVNETSDINNEGDEELAITDAIILIKKENLCGIEVKKGEKRMMLKIDDEEEWIPSYISLRTGKPIFGQQAKLDYEDYPESVIFDIFKLIGKKYNEINQDPKWGFKIKKTEDNDDFNIVVKFIEEEREISIETVVAIVFQAMKLFTESIIEEEIQNEIKIQVDFELNLIAKDIIFEACKKTQLFFQQ